MKQRAVTFGPDEALVGVLTIPKTSVAGAPVVLLTNSGVLPRQGPHRMNVRIARALAAVGIPSLRFDLSGHGDSQAIGNPEGLRAQSVLDFKSAMDFVQQAIGASRFLVVGVCSSAVSGFDLAVADDRVAGLLMLDGFTYKSRWTTVMRDLKRAMDADWKARGAAIWRRLAPSTQDAPKSEAPVEDQSASADISGGTPLSVFAAGLQTLADRGTDVFVLYGGSIIDYYSYAGQFRDVFGNYPFFSRVRCELHPDLDHTFITRRAQEHMIDLVRDWALVHVDNFEAVTKVPEREKNVA